MPRRATRGAGPGPAAGDQARPLLSVCERGRSGRAGSRPWAPSTGLSLGVWCLARGSGHEASGPECDSREGRWRLGVLGWMV